MGLTFVGAWKETYYLTQTEAWPPIPFGIHFPNCG